MNRNRMTRLLMRFIGKRTFCRMQSLLKFLLVFRGDYGFSMIQKYGGHEKQRYVFMIDGKTIHGGLRDRLRGLFSTYYYCKTHDKEFRVCWTDPFLLTDYLMPKYSWLIRKDELSFNLRDVAFRYFNSYCCLDCDERNFFAIMKSDKKEVHVYSNVTLREDCYHDFFNELFTPAPALQAAFDDCMKSIRAGYVSVTFRFIGILGDFTDHSGFGEQCTEKEKECYIEKSMGAIKRLHERYPDKQILVTADSNRFIKEASKLEYVYIPPGSVQHMDFYKKNDQANTSDTKAFLDMLCIKNADASFDYTTGKMFGFTRFAKTASLLGNHPYMLLRDENL